MINEYSIFSSTWNWFDSHLSFVIEIFTNRDWESSLINWNNISVHIRIYIHAYPWSFPFWNFDGRISFTNAKGDVVNSIWFVRTASIESLHLSFFYSRFLNFSLFLENRIWLRIAHCEFQGFSEFESSHLVSFHTKTQSN